MGEGTHDARPGRLLGRHERGAREPFERLHVARGGGRDDVGVQGGWWSVARVAGVEQRPSNDFLVQALGLVAGGQPLVVGVCHPVARRVRRVHLVDEQQFPVVGRHTELVLRVGKDEPRPARHVLPAFEQRQRCGAHAPPHLGFDQAPSDHVGRRDRLVVRTRLGLGGGRDHVVGQCRVLAETVGELDAVDGARPIGVLTPERGGGDTGDVTAHDHLDGQRMCGAADGAVGVGHLEQVVGDDVARGGEPPRRQLVEHLALAGHRADDLVERRETVGRDEQALVLRQPVRHTHLAGAPIRQRQVDVVEGVHIDSACATPRSNNWRPSPP